MNNVLYGAVAAGLLVTISALVQHLHTAYGKGPRFILTDRSEPLARTGFAGRAARTLQNNVESAAMATPLLLVVHALGIQSELVLYASYLYVGARVAYTLFYWLGVSALRSMFWALGMMAIAYFAWVAIASLAGIPLAI